jgi:hypothetical protein
MKHFSRFNGMAAKQPQRPTVGIMTRRGKTLSILFPPDRTASSPAGRGRQALPLLYKVVCAYLDLIGRLAAEIKKAERSSVNTLLTDFFALNKSSDGGLNNLAQPSVRVHPCRSISETELQSELDLAVTLGGAKRPKASANVITDRDEIGVVQGVEHLRTEL